MEPPFDYPSSVVEDEHAVIFCIDSELRITYCNPAWDQFATDNGGQELCRPAPIGRCILDYIVGPDRDFYARKYRRILSQDTPREWDYECSSKDVYRKFRSRAIPTQNKSGLLIMNFVLVEHPHQLAACAPLEEVYRTDEGLIAMCASCRRTRRNISGTAAWDWVPDFVACLPMQVSHGLCGPCLHLYYPDDHE